MKIYGWTEQNEAAYGIDCAEVDGREFAEEIKEARKRDNKIVFIPYREGQWFLTFAAAKKEALEHWTYSFKAARRALHDIRKVTKKSVIEALSSQ